MTIAAAVEISGKVRGEYKRLASKYGITGDRDFRGAIVTGIREVFEEHGSMFGDRAVSDSMLKDKAKSIVAQSTSPALASEFVDSMWDNGLRASTLRELLNSTPTDSQAGGAIAKTMQVTNGDLIMANEELVGGVLVGANYAPLVKNLINCIMRLDQVMGTLDSSDGVREAFRSALSENSPEEMLVRQIRAAEAYGQGGRAATLRSKLHDYVGDEDKVDSLLGGYSAAAYGGEDKETRVALSRASAASEKHEGNTGIRLEVAKERLVTLRTIKALGIGASKLSRDYDITSLKTMELTVHGFANAMKNIGESPTQMAALNKASRILGDAVKRGDVRAFKEGIMAVSKSP